MPAQSEWLSIPGLNPTCVPPHVIPIHLAAHTTSLTQPGFTRLTQPISPSSQLVNKDVWAHLLSDEAEDSVVMPEFGPGIDADMALLPQDHLLGGYKRPRAATSLSSNGGDSVDDLRFLSNGEGLVNGFLSLELSQLINHPGVRPREIPGPRPHKQ